MLSIVLCCTRLPRPAKALLPPGPFRHRCPTVLIWQCSGKNYRHRSRQRFSGAASGFASLCAVVQAHHLLR